MSKRMTSAQMLAGGNVPTGGTPATRTSSVAAPVTVSVPKGGQVTVKKAEGGAIVTVTDARWNSTDTVVPDGTTVRIG